MRRGQARGAREDGAGKGAAGPRALGGVREGEALQSWRGLGPVPSPLPASVLLFLESVGERFAPPGTHSFPAHTPGTGELPLACTAPSRSLSPREARPDPWTRAALQAHPLKLIASHFSCSVAKGQAPHKTPNPRSISHSRVRGAQALLSNKVEVETRGPGSEALVFPSGCLCLPLVGLLEFNLCSLCLGFPCL